MDTKPVDLIKPRRRRRLHSAEFKAQAVLACRQPGVSMASVAMSNGVNANLLRRWVIEAERQDSACCAPSPVPTSSPSFVALQLPAPAAPADIRINLQRGTTSISVTWPATAASECAAWLRELLR